MWAGVITGILKFVFGLIGKDYAEMQKSKAKALAARAESVSESYAEQDKAKKEAEVAAKKAAEGGSDEDVFGAEDYANED